MCCAAPGRAKQLQARPAVLEGGESPVQCCLVFGFLRHGLRLKQFSAQRRSLAVQFTQQISGVYMPGAVPSPSERARAGLCVGVVCHMSTECFNSHSCAKCCFYHCATDKETCHQTFEASSDQNTCLSHFRPRVLAVISGGPHNKAISPPGRCCGSWFSGY